MQENVEEAIDRLEYVNRAYDCNNYYSRYDLDCIQILLSDYKRVLEINEVLLKENEKLKNKLLDILEEQKVIKEETPQYIKKNYISKENKRQLMRSALRKDRYYNKFIRE